MKTANPPLRPDAFTWVCVGLVVFPTIFLLIAASALALSGPEGMVGFAVLGAGFSLFLAGPLLFTEYLAILRCNVRASGLIVGALVYLLALGVVGWLFNLVELLRSCVTPRPHPVTLADFAILSAFVAFVFLVSLGHLRWHRRLKSVATVMGDI